jgi:predicted permease
MLAQLGAAFAATVTAVLDIFVIVLIAGLLVRRGVLADGHVRALSQATIMVFLPCLIFANISTNLEPSALPFWWVIPLAAIAMSFVGLGLGVLAFLPDVGARRDLLPVASMQNAGFLVLPVGLALFPDQFDRFAMYCFLFILGFNPVLWSVGAFLSTGGRRSSWRALVTPPLVANLLAIGGVLTGVSARVPLPVMRAIDLMGQATVPVAMLVLGAALGGVRLRLGRHLGDAARAMAVKLVLLPLLTVLVLVHLDLGEARPLLARFFVIEAAAAPAAGIILQVRAFGGAERKIGAVMLASYVACAVTLPLWVAVWEVLGAG